jgi:hypothetical protein
MDFQSLCQCIFHGTSRTDLNFLLTNSRLDQQSGLPCHEPTYFAASKGAPKTPARSPQPGPSLPPSKPALSAFLTTLETRACQITFWKLALGT